MAEHVAGQQNGQGDGNEKAQTYGRVEHAAGRIGHGLVVIGYVFGLFGLGGHQIVDSLLVGIGSFSALAVQVGRGLSHAFRH